MSYDRPSFYLTFGGVLFPAAGNHEQWQTGVRFTNGETHELGDYESALGRISVSDILADCTNLIRNGMGKGPLWANTVTIDWAKLVVLDTNGHYATAPVVAEQTGVTGMAGSFAHPPQLAMAVSLWSGQTFGRANRGRMYLPAPHTSVISITVADPRINANEATYLRDAVSQWLHDVSGEVSTINLPTYPAIMSKLGTGSHRPVLKIGVGRVMDTMRSRRAQLDEATVYTDW